MDQLIECVPNFSEGKDTFVIRKITDAIENVKGIKLLHVDSGKSANRTVITFVGSPDVVVEAAFQGIKEASLLIDMSIHKGEHPRVGATDVCPLIPVANISMDETVEYAHKLAKRVGEELNIPVYCYEYAAKHEIRRSLSSCRSGQYEGLQQKLDNPNWKPDYGPDTMNTKSGATIIGARNFLIAYNVNLDTTSVSIANEIASEIRESGKIERKDGNPVRIPGKLLKVKAIGWYIDEYGIAQVSTNLTDSETTSIHVVYEEVQKNAERRGVRVTGSELIGLIPLKAILETGNYFLKKQKKSTEISETEKIDFAVKTLGLDELKPFNPQERIIEYLIKY